MHQNVSHAKSALFWDESFLWGLIACEALREAGLPFELLRSADIRKGRLKDYRLLFVPGGWASNKIKSLGDEGVREIRRFVADGGSYLGFCGGAGLATRDGIGLIGVKRKPTRERVPSFSGGIMLRLVPHPLWNGITQAEEGDMDLSGAEGDSLPVSGQKPLVAVFHAWWPSQLTPEEQGLKILACFDKALPDSFSSDLNVGDVGNDAEWQGLEELYRINLNPGRLLGGAAVIEGRYGKGKVIVSLVHFDTPDDPNGAVVLRNLWEYLSGEKTEHRTQNRGIVVPDSGLVFRDPGVSGVVKAVDDLIDLGVRNFLWFWRTPMLLQWRRGVRGLEYCTLSVMIKEVARLMEECGGISAKGNASGEATPEPSLGERLGRVRERLHPFLNKAGKLLVLERQAMQRGVITYESCDDPEIREMRTELFASSKSHGGLFKELIDEVDDLLYALMKREG